MGSVSWTSGKGPDPKRYCTTARACEDIMDYTDHRKHRSGVQDASHQTSGQSLSLSWLVSGRRAQVTGKEPHVTPAYFDRRPGID